MANLSQKIKAFEYLIEKLILWSNDETGLPVESSFDKLKLLKLLFFAAAVNSSKHNEGLLDVFNKFYALPYGHVESDVYDHLNTLQVYTVTSKGIVVNQTPANYYDEISDLMPRINEAVKSLRSFNSSLVTYNGLDLVELSHSYDSWKTTFNMARNLNKFSLPIPTELIKTENKNFSLEQFA